MSGIGWGAAFGLNARYALIEQRRTSERLTGTPDAGPAASDVTPAAGCIDCGGELVGENPFYCRDHRPTHVWGRE